MKAYECIKNELLYRYTYILQEYCLDIMQLCITFRNFQSSYFTKILSRNDSRSRVFLCNGWCNVILHAYTNCWQTLRIDSPSASLNDIPLKRITRHLQELIFNPVQDGRGVGEAPYQFSSYNFYKRRN